MRDAFAPFGQVIEMADAPDFAFNEGRAERWADLVKGEVDAAGRLGVSLCRSRPVANPYELTFLERHPLGSQAFMPLDARPFLVIVAPDAKGVPGEPVIFVTNGGQGINYARGTWHGALAPIGSEQRFLIYDRVAGEGDNLEVHEFREAVLIEFDEG